MKEKPEEGPSVLGAGSEEEAMKEKPELGAASSTGAEEFIKEKEDPASWDGLYAAFGSSVTLMPPNNRIKKEEIIINVRPKVKFWETYLNAIYLILKWLWSEHQR